MSQFEQSAGCIETSDPERSCAFPLDLNFAASVLHSRNLIEWYRQPPRTVAGEEGV